MSFSFAKFHETIQIRKYIEEKQFKELEEFLTSIAEDNAEAISNTLFFIYNSKNLKQQEKIKLLEKIMK